MQKAIFFDRDGVVNRRLVGDYIKKLEDFDILNDCVEIIKKIKDLGFLAILITNQQGIGKGMMNESELEIIHDFMQNELSNRINYQFDDIFFCGDLAGSNSLRRKPNPGMLLEAIEKWGINPNESYFIGDSRSDAKAGRAAGTKTILVGDFSLEDADYIFSDLSELNKNIINLISK